MESLSVSELHVLLVEPSTTQRKIIEKTLVDAQVTSMEYAETIEDALVRVEASKPDLVISCLHLSDGTATTMVDRIQSLHNNEIIPFILVSSESRHSHLEYFKQKGIVAILPKPFDISQLESALQATLDYLNPMEIELDFFEVDTLNVLVVDDSTMARKAIIKVLNNIGVEHITEAVNGLEATMIAEDQAYDIIFTDMNMPNMDGVEFTEHIRSTESLAHIPVLMVTSEQNDATLSAINKAGVDAIIGKPFEPQHVRTLIAKLLSS